jgi:hypothetical protein
MPSTVPQFSLPLLQQSLSTDVIVADAARPEPDVPPPRAAA